MKDKIRLLWQQIPSPVVSEILCSAKNLDGIVLDVEHGVFSNESLYSCIQVATLNNKLCLVRVPEFNKSFIRYSLDSGADGMIFSTVEDYNTAKEISEQCSYPKFGGKRGVGLMRENFWGEKKLQDKTPLIIPQIETERGVGNLEEIARLRFDYFLIGPYDLSASLGDAGNFENPAFKLAVERIKSTVGVEKTGYHIVKDIEYQLPRLKDAGLLAFSTDTLMILDGVKKLDELINNYSK